MYAKGEPIELGADNQLGMKLLIYKAVHF